MTDATTTSQPSGDAQRPAAPPRPRLLYVDNLRVTLTVLVVLHHCILTYSPVALWYYHEQPKDASGIALYILLFVNQAFVMASFFLVAGYLTPSLLDHQDGRRSVRDPLVRLGLPLLFFLLVVRPIVTVPWSLASPLPYWLFYIVSVRFNPGPNWFLEVLLAFTLVYVLIRRLPDGWTGASDPPPAALPDSPLSGWAIVGYALALTVGTYVWQIFVPPTTFVPVLGLPTPYFLPQYASMFALGVVAFRRNWFATLPRRFGWFAGGGAVFALLVLLLPALLPAGPVANVASAAFESIFAVGMTVALLILFRERFDAQGPVRRFLSRNAFAVYVLHPIVLTYLAIALSGLSAPAAVKALVLAVPAVPLCWGLATAVRAIPLLRRIL